MKTCGQGHTKMTMTCWKNQHSWTMGKLCPPATAEAWHCQHSCEQGDKESCTGQGACRSRMKTAMLENMILLDSGWALSTKASSITAMWARLVTKVWTLIDKLMPDDWPGLDMLENLTVPGSGEFCPPKSAEVWHCEWSVLLTRYRKLHLTRSAQKQDEDCTHWRMWLSWMMGELCPPETAVKVQRCDHSILWRMYGKGEITPDEWSGLDKL